MELGAGKKVRLGNVRLMTGCYLNDLSWRIIEQQREEGRGGMVAKVSMVWIEERERI